MIIGCSDDTNAGMVFFLILVRFLFLSLIVLLDELCVLDKLNSLCEQRVFKCFALCDAKGIAYLLNVAKLYENGAFSMPNNKIISQQSNPLNWRDRVPVVARMRTKQSRRRSSTQIASSYRASHNQVGKCTHVFFAS